MVDDDKRKGSFMWPADTGWERRLIPQKRALFEITLTSAAGLFLPEIKRLNLIVYALAMPPKPA
jgi:hypothetical protein